MAFFKTQNNTYFLLFPSYFFILSPTHHTALCLPLSSCCPIKTGMMSRSLQLRMRRKTESKVHSSDGILLSACLVLVSQSVCVSDHGISGHPDSPVTPPGLCVRRKEGRPCGHTGGRVCRKGGRKCERVSQLELIHSTGASHYRMTVWKGTRPNASVCLHVWVCVHFSLKQKLFAALFSLIFSSKIRIVRIISSM